MREKLYRSYLYDFYGDLLNDHQKDLFEVYHFQDLSLSEIAEQAGTTRQGVYDSIARTERRLLAYEEKLRLLDRYTRVQEKVKELSEAHPDLAADLQEITDILFEE